MSAQITALMDRIKDEMYALAADELSAAMVPMLDQMYSELKGYRPLTGNANNSIAVGFYLDRKLIGYANARNLSTSIRRPTRKTLKRGDVYRLPVTWLGNRLNSPIGGYSNPKTDWVGDDSFWADEEAIAFLSSQAPSHKGFAYVFVSAIDYAKYLESKGKVNVLTQWRNELASMGADVSELR